MDKKTAKVIEKYSMPFVQLVLEKGEEEKYEKEPITSSQINHFIHDDCP